MNDETLFLTGSICLDDLLAALKAGHSAFSKSQKNGKTYIAIKEWVNAEPNETTGNHASLLLNSDQNAPEAEKGKKFYIGNLKKQKTGGAPVSAEQGTNMAAQFEAITGNVPVYAPAAPADNGLSGPSGPGNNGGVTDLVVNPGDKLPF